MMSIQKIIENSQHPYSIQVKNKNRRIKSNLHPVLSVSVLVISPARQADNVVSGLRVAVICKDAACVLDDWFSYKKIQISSRERVSCQRIVT